MRQALAGMLWSKQYFFMDTDKWLEEHGVDVLRQIDHKSVRNREWFHLIADNVISMPDKWEYPWFAAWDLAFHTIALATVDIDFAKQQLDLLLQQLYLHPTGQIPAYEWNFSDVNPPVQAWAAIYLYRQEQMLNGNTDIDFLKRIFGRLSANFGWWINRKDRFGEKPFRRRISRAGQHRRIRPQRPAADRRPSGAGRRHRLGRSFLPEHAGDRRRACGARYDLRRTRNHIWIGVSAYRPSDEHGRPDTVCGTRRTVFTTMSFACPTEPRQG